MSRTPRVLPAGPRLAAKAAAERQVRRDRRLKRAGLTAAAGLPVVVLGWLVLASPVLAVQDVSVTGSHRVDRARIAAAAAAESGTPLARVDTSAVERRVRALGPIASVTVTRDWPHGLRVRVVERVPVVAVPGDGQLQLLDADGLEVAEVAAVPHGVYRLDASSPEATRAALTVLQGLPRGLRGRLGAMRAPSPDAVTLVLRDGRQVLWGGTGDGAAKAAAALALIGMPGTVYDVSAPGVVTRR